MVAQHFPRAFSVLSVVAGLACAQPVAPVTPVAPTPPPPMTVRTNVPLVTIAPSATQVVEDGYDIAANYARTEVESVRHYFSLPGMSAGVLLDGRVVWQEGFGLADMDAQRVVTPDTRFRIGSISKPISALAMATLVEAGTLDLDAPIQTYVPSFPEKDGVITCRLLVGHLSGIRHYRPGEDDTIRPRRYETMDDALSRFADDPLVAPPGTRYRYSTYAYTLLGAAMESAAGEPFLDLLQRSVFDPVGMRATSADSSVGDIPNLTSFYHRARNSAPIPALPIDTSYKWAGGGLVSTSGDLLRFAGEMMEPTVITPEFRDQMWTPMADTSGNSTHYGMGWSVGADEYNRRLIAHSGGQVGCTAYLLIYPDLNAAAVILCNITNAEFGRDLAISIVEPFLKRRAELAAERAGEEAGAGASATVGH